MIRNECAGRSEVLKAWLSGSHVDEDLACAGNSNEAFARGAVYCYRFSGTSNTWAREHKFVSGPGSNEWLGYSVSIDDDRIAVGAPLSNNGSGLTYVYRRSNGSWQHEDVIGAGMTSARDGFGSSTVVSENVLASLSPTHSTSVPAVHVFGRIESTSEWQLESTLRSERQGPESITGSRIACDDGMAAIFPCMQVDLLSYLPIHAVGGPGVLNDVWGWTAPDTGREYVVLGRSDGAAFIDVSDPINPVYLGILPTNAEASSTRDVKVFKDFALVVADGAGDHGM